MAELKTSTLTASSAQICRDLGWEVGNELESIDDGAFACRIQITAIGDEHVLAIGIVVDGIEIDDPRENLWNLTCRNWQKI